MTDRIGQNAIQANANVSGIRETSAAVSSAAIKYNPGWGVVTSAPTYTKNQMPAGSDINVINEIALMPNVSMFCPDGVYWGNIETAEDVYNFDTIDAFMDLCIEKNLRFMFKLQWSAISAGNEAYQVSQGRFPAYLNTNGWLHADLVNRVDVRMHIPQAMDRWLALCDAVGNHLNSVARFEGMRTYDSTCSSLVSSSAIPDPTFTVDLYAEQFIRMMPSLRDSFPNTSVFLSMDSGFGSSIPLRQSIVQAAADNRMVFLANDIYPVHWLPDGTGSGGTGGTQFTRIYTGRDGTKSFFSEMGFCAHVAQNNLGANGATTAAQFDQTKVLTDLWYPAVRNTLRAQWAFMPYKLTGFSEGGTTNDQFWNTAAAGYTLYHPTIKEFLQKPASQIALLPNNVPANYGAVITGGT